MRICVVGLWHLGLVTSSCLASTGHTIAGYDPNSEIIDRINKNSLPIDEPGLSDMIETCINDGSLSFSNNAQRSIQDAELVWITFDTPVDQNDQADSKTIIEEIERLISYVQNSTIILISSQLPVGTTDYFYKKFHKQYPQKEIHMAYSPENLRLGKAINTFLKRDRVVIGTNSDKAKSVLSSLFNQYTKNILWMSPSSAEMTKHAINAFLANSIAFINEVANLCEFTGADAKEVERGLKSEERIGPKAYLSPGGAFAGGTLARDLIYLKELANQNNYQTPLISGIIESNNMHKFWAIKTLSKMINFTGNKIAIWGLAYKPNTNTLRRSLAIELCNTLYDKGASVFAYDPAIKTLPDSSESKINLCSSKEETLSGASGLIIATEWKDFLSVDPSIFESEMKTPIIVDANRFLVETIGDYPNIKYFSVGINENELS